MIALDGGLPARPRRGDSGTVPEREPVDDFARTLDDERERGELAGVAAAAPADGQRVDSTVSAGDGGTAPAEERRPTGRPVRGRREAGTSKVDESRAGEGEAKQADAKQADAQVEGTTPLDRYAAATRSQTSSETAAAPAGPDGDGEAEAEPAARANAGDAGSTAKAGSETAGAIAPSSTAAATVVGSTPVAEAAPGSVATPVAGTPFTEAVAPRSSAGGEPQPPLPAPASAPAPAAADAEVGDDWRARTAATRARVVVGSGDDRVSLLVALERNGVKVIARAAHAEMAAALMSGSGELDAALREHGQSLASFTAESDESSEPREDETAEDERVENPRAVRRGVRAIA